MAYATYGGINIFGLELRMTTVDNPRAHQQNSYPGLSGVESLDQGLRGRFTNVSGRLYGFSPGDLAAAEETFRSYNDGYARVLVDTRGVAWPYVKLLSFEPEMHVRLLAAQGIYTRRYTAQFMHLV